MVWGRLVNCGFASIVPLLILHLFGMVFAAFHVF